MGSTIFETWRCRRLRGVLLLLSCLVAGLPLTTALHVVPGSNCTAVCSQTVDATNTTSVDITCYDEDYNGTDVGRTFRDCTSVSASLPSTWSSTLAAAFSGWYVEK